MGRSQKEAAILWVMLTDTLKAGDRPSTNRVAVIETNRVVVT